MSSFLGLPNEVLLAIVKNLDMSDLKNLVLTGGHPTLFIPVFEAAVLRLSDLKNLTPVGCHPTLFTPVFEAAVLKISKVKPPMGGDFSGYNMSQICRMPALCWAIDGEFNILAKMLIDNGTNLNTPVFDSLRRSPLQIAVRHGPTNRAMIKLLIDLGANTNNYDTLGMSVLHNAAISDSVTMVALLLDFGCQIDHECRGGQTAFHHALHYGRLANAKFLLRKGADMGRCSPRGHTALHFAAMGEFNVIKAPIVRWLLEMGADPNAKDSSGDTPLHLAAISEAGLVDTYEVVELLLKNGADVNMQGNYGMTALHVATREETYSYEKSIADLLLDYGADPLIEDSDGLYADLE